MFGALQLFQPAGKDGKLSDPQKTSIPSVLQRELGILLQSKRDLNLITAINDPVKFVKDREKKLTDAAADVATRVYIPFYEQLMAAGVPADFATEWATEKAKREYEDVVKIEELQNPGLYEKAYGLAGNDYGKVGATAINYNRASTILGDSTNVDIRAAAVSEYKQRKRAKKAAKRAAKSSL